MRPRMWMMFCSGNLQRIVPSMARSKFEPRVTVNHFPPSSGSTHMKTRRVRSGMISVIAPRRDTPFTKYEF